MEHVDSQVDAAGFLTNPIDVIKTRMMTDRVRSLSILESAREIYADEGLKGFSRGVGVRTFGTMLITVVLFVCYENLKTRLDRAIYGTKGETNLITL